MSGLVSLDMVGYLWGPSCARARVGLGLRLELSRCVVGRVGRQRRGIENIVVRQCLVFVGSALAGPQSLPGISYWVDSASFLSNCWGRVDDGRREWERSGNIWYRCRPQYQTEQGRAVLWLAGWRSVKNTHLSKFYALQVL